MPVSYKFNHEENCAIPVFVKKSVLIPYRNKNVYTFLFLDEICAKISAIRGVN